MITNKNILDKDCQDFKGKCWSCPFYHLTILCDYAYFSQKSEMLTFAEIIKKVKNEIDFVEFNYE